MTHLDPDLDRLGDALRTSIAIHLAREEQAGHATSQRRSGHGAAGRLGWSRLHPRTLAGGTLGLAGIGAALVLALSAGGATAPPAFAITTHSDGSVLVQLDRQEDLSQANQKLADMGTHEQITLYLLSGAAAATGPVSCTSGPGAGPPDPPVQVVVGPDSTSSGRGAGDSGEESSNLVCLVGPHTYSGPYHVTAGNAGAG